MAIFKCKMCGGALEINNNETVATCEYCGTKQTLPRLDDDRKANLFDRANHFRRNNEFDKAMGIYEQILIEDNTDAEAYWSLVLCRYGIEYVEDPSSHKRIPTVNRAQFTSVFDDDNYKSALQYADGYQHSIYEEEAKAINEIQKGILAISQKEEPFDVFICYKETDSNGRRTPDSVLANDLYHQLTQEGFKVFFARITLEDKLGSAYEPYIFAALNSAKVMVVLGTKPEFFNAVWVKNEWSRYLSLIKNGAKKMLIPAYKDMDPYDLPEEFSHLQAQDMSKLGFMQDLTRGIQKILDTDTPAKVVKETIVQAAPSASIAPLLKRAFMFLEDGEFDRADEFCEQVLNQDPECAEAYLGKLMAELQVCKQEDLADCEQPFDEHNNYNKVVRFADEMLSKTLKGYISHINERNENARLEGIYKDAVSIMNGAKTETAFNNALHIFETVSEYKDADELAKKCYEKAEQLKKERLTKEETDRLETERKVEENRITAEKAAKRRKRAFVIIISIVCVCIAFGVVLNTVIIPTMEYNDAVALMNAGKYEEAIAAFESMSDYEDSTEQIKNCQNAIKDIGYSAAIELMNQGKYEEAISAFESMGDYKDSVEQIKNCQNAKKDFGYYAAIELMNQGKYEEAISAFESMGDYKDSVEQMKNCQNAKKDIDYDAAIALMNQGKYDEALTQFQKLGDYKDCKAQTESCKSMLFTEVFVSTPQELLENIGNYKKLILTSSSYNLSSITSVKNNNVKKSNFNDGYEICNVNDLVIQGNAKIEINDKSADVLFFNNCNAIELIDLTIGHTQINKDYQCDGDVVRIENSENIAIKNCKLFGCGAVGINCWQSKNIIAEYTEIYECNFAGISVQYSDIQLNKCNIHDFNLIAFNSGLIKCCESEIKLTDCVLDRINAEIIFHFDGYSGEITSISCSINGSSYIKLTDNANDIKCKNCNFAN